MKITSIFRPFKTVLQLALLLVGLSTSLNSYALDLQAAKQSGWVGEQQNGYLGLVTPNPEAQTLLKTVNQKRKSVYQKLAQEHGLTLEQVSLRAGRRNIERTQTGLMVQSSSGQWIKK